MKPRIFVNMHYMALGGTERTLLGLLNVLDPARVEVDLLLEHVRAVLPKSDITSAQSHKDT
ncbi:MAG: hypothetical protein IJ160_12910 [Muribaculaceae bacterium]|nr:hypothetical protein [Muribaculaceae bacterium]